MGTIEIADNMFHRFSQFNPYDVLTSVDIHFSFFIVHGEYFLGPVVVSFFQFTIFVNVISYNGRIGKLF